MIPLTRIALAAGLLASPALLAKEPAKAPAPRPAPMPAPTVSSGPAANPQSGSWSFRFGLGLEPMLSDAHYDLDDGSEYDYDWEAPGLSLEFNAAHRFASRGPHSAYISAGAFLRGFGGSDDPDRGNDVALGALGLQVGGGWSWQASPQYTLEVGPRISIGSAGASEEVCDGQGKIESDSGLYGRFGVGATNLFSVGRLQFAVDAGIASWAAATTYDNPTTVSTSCGNLTFPGGDVTYSGGGIYLLGSIGFH